MNKERKVKNLESKIVVDRRYNGPVGISYDDYESAFKREEYERQHSEYVLMQVQLRAMQRRDPYFAPF